jgi:hypothetical protein
MSTKTDQILLADIPPLKRLADGQNDAETQSGDLQGLSWAETTDSQSVAELAADGQSFEAEAVIGVEDADDNPVQEVKTRQVLEDDVPLEYLDSER